MRINPFWWWNIIFSEFKKEIVKKNLTQHFRGVLQEVCIFTPLSKIVRYLWGELRMICVKSWVSSMCQWAAFQHSFNTEQARYEEVNWWIAFLRLHSREKKCAKVRMWGFFCQRRTNGCIYSWIFLFISFQQPVSWNRPSTCRKIWPVGNLELYFPNSVDHSGRRKRKFCSQTI